MRNHFTTRARTKEAWRVCVMEGRRVHSREVLEQQLDELELLQSVFSRPEEFSADPLAMEGATAWVRRLTAEAPAARLSCSLHLSVDLHCSRESDEDCGSIAEPSSSRRAER